MKIISVKIPKTYLEDIDRLVREGRYASRSEFIRTALKLLLIREYERRDNPKDRHMPEDNNSKTQNLLYAASQNSFKKIVINL
ncbi:MAG: type II toxin-antitoxin system ParD family antitoxin [Desulfurococcaceae archaeon]|nr:type II toxin-antitoxin system ParD family antitoxin [Desulfurococcaceae archaeon]